MTRLLSLLLLLGICRYIHAFKESEFKKCQNSAFCTRNRQVTDGRRYRLLADSLAFTETKLTGHLRNDAVKKDFLFTLTSISGPSVRLEVTEASPVERYRVRDVLIADPPPPGERWIVHRSDQEMQLTLLDGRQIILHYNPFQIMLEDQGKQVMIVNANGLMHVEHDRPREENATSGEWEETFKSFKDSKPNGPQALSLDVTFVNCGHVFGIPEHSSHLSLPVTVEKGQPVSEPYRLYNLDVFEYNLYSPFGLYGSIPFLLGQNADRSAGVFWLNSAEMYVDIWKDETGTHSQWIAESGVLDVFLMLGPFTKDVLQQYASLTGTTALPQYFSLGYHQCRWNYRDEADVKHVDANFDKFGIPYDVLWLDIEHTDRKMYMTWDDTAFPNPEAMQEDLASRGRKMVVIVDPHIKVDDRYAVYSEAKKKGYYVKNTDGTDFVGHCWPGSSSYLDITRPEVRDWWARHFLIENYEGMTRHLYIWNDMNEPSVFNGPEITMQKDLLHSGTVEHRDVHNLYGFLYHMSTVEGLMLRGHKLYGAAGDRPFVLSRAYFAGSQRLGPIWTGDNIAEWSHLKASIPMLLSNNLAGMAFCGADLAGFFGNPDAELFTRWYQVGVFYPFVRGHAHIETKRREPWVFGDETTMRIQKALRERYALLPYIYTVFRTNNLTGAPIMRPLWYEFPKEDIFELEEQFMVGPSLMIRPVFEAGATAVDTYFSPTACWYNAWTGEKIQTTAARSTLSINVNLESIPFYYRGGSIIVRKERPRRSTAAMTKDPVTLIVALDEHGKAEGEVYMDDGHSYAFLQSHYVHRTFTYANNKLTSVSLSDSSAYKANIKVEKIIILGLTKNLDVYEAGSMRRIESSLGPLRLEPKAPIAGLVIKKPEVSIDADWTLLVSIPKQ